MPAVRARAVSVPGVEDGSDGSAELHDRFLGKVLTGMRDQQFPELFGEPAERGGVQLAVVPAPDSRRAA